MLIVDAQVHLWTDGRVVTPSNAHHRHQAIYSKNDLLTEMAEAGVDRAVIIPPSWTGNAHALEAAHEHPDRFALMGRIAIDRDKGLDLGLGAFVRSQPGMLGLRLVFNPENRHLLIDGTADWIWPAAERAGIPLMILAPGLLHRIGVIAENHPDLRIIVDHFGVGRNTQGPAAFDHLPELITLSRFPNVAVKATGLAGNSAEQFPFADIAPFIRRGIDSFGPNRVFWGTDITRMRCSYLDCVKHFTEGLPFLSQSDKELVMGKALCRWLGWPERNAGNGDRLKEILAKTLPIN